jgi:hypothetical protein
MADDEVVMMKVGDEVMQICREIKEIGLTEQAWDDHRSDDGIQVGAFWGGYHDPEDQFWFFFTDTYWRTYCFQIRLDDVEKILSGEITRIRTELESRLDPEEVKKALGPWAP